VSCLSAGFIDLPCQAMCRYKCVPWGNRTYYRSTSIGCLGRFESRNTWESPGRFLGRSRLGRFLPIGRTGCRSQGFDQPNQFRGFKPQVEKGHRFECWFPHSRLAGAVRTSRRRSEAALSASERKEKAPSTFSSPGRLGSPPPELPNHEMDIRIPFILCKRHFGNSVSGKLI
jgi:hypothetical protein